MSAVPQQKSATEGRAWDNAKQGLLVVEHLGRPTGVAAMIDAAGLVLVHKSALRGGVINVRGQDGAVFIAVIVSEDEVTQTALLQVPPLIAGAKALPVAFQSRPGQRIVAATMAGPAYGQIVATDRVGQMRPSLRYLPLSEVWMESGSATESPAVLVNEQGEIVGLLGASLAENSRPNAAESLSGSGSRAAIAEDFGPRSLQVSYAIGTKVMKRVVEGFRSPSRTVHHPTIGVLFRMSSGAGGVILETVLSGSTAEAAGLRVGDRVLRVDGKTVNDSVQLAIALFEATPGSTVSIEYERDGQSNVAKVLVAGQTVTLTSRTIHL